MIAAFSSSLATALGTFKTDLTTGIGDNLDVVLPVVLGLVGIFILWGVVRHFLHAR